jgi:hypothetical protein
LKEALHRISVQCQSNINSRSHGTAVIPHPEYTTIWSEYDTWGILKKVRRRRMRKTMTLFKKKMRRTQGGKEYIDEGDDSDDEKEEGAERRR